jgi:hypothetical protein
MTAKEKLRQAVERLSEEQAEEALRFLDQRVRDPLLEAVERAPFDDEPVTADEEQSAAESWDEYQRGEAVPLHEIRHELE